jgi:hypothetical protein
MYTSKQVIQKTGISQNALYSLSRKSKSLLKPQKVGKLSMYTEKQLFMIVDWVILRKEVSRLKLEMKTLLKERNK